MMSTSSRSSREGGGAFARGAWREAFAPYGQAIRTSFRTIMALVLRESRARYGQRSAGYVWALISPMILLVTMILLFSVIGRPAGAGDSMVVFFLTAIIPIFLWRGSVAQGGNAVRANRTLMHYPQVNMFEVVTARTLLESLTLFIVLVLFVLIMFAFFGLPFTAWIDRPLPLLGAIGAVGLLVYGSCFLSSQIGRMFDPWNDVTGPLGRIMLLSSGLWFTMGSLPPELLSVIKYNPMAHIVEWIRASVIQDFHSELYDPFYPIAVGTAFLAIGLFIDWLYRISGYDRN